MAAYNRGDYVPAIRVFRTLAEQGNAKAQNVLGVMFRKGEGVPKNPARAHMWFSFAAKRGRGRGQSRIARGVADDDGAGDFAGGSNGESVRGVELSGSASIRTGPHGERARVMAISNAWIAASLASAFYKR